MTEPTVDGIIAIMPPTSSAIDTGETLALKQQLLPLPGLFFGSALRGDADNDTAALHTNLRSACGAICHQVSDAQLPQLGFLAGVARVKDSAVVKSAAEKEACHEEKELPFAVCPTLVVIMIYVPHCKPLSSIITASPSLIKDCSYSDVSSTNDGR